MITFGIIPVTGNEAFDYFFTLNFTFVLIAIGPSLLFKLLKW